MELCYDGALVMPSSYMVMDEDEMSYTEGGEAKYLSKQQCINGLISVGINSPQAAIAGALTFTLAKLFIKKVAAFCGVAAVVVSTILSWAATQVVNFGISVARGAINNGVTISWNWNPLRDPIGINATVH